MFVPVPNVIQLRVQATYLDQPVENVFHALAVEAPYNAAGAINLATAVRDTWVASVLPPLNINYICQQVRAIGQGSETDFSVTVPFVGAPAGSNATEPMSGQSAFVLTARTNKRGPWNRGRSYLAGLSDSECEGNFVSQAFANAALAGYQAVRATIVATGYVPVVVSREYQGAPRTIGLSELLTLWNVRSLRIRTQRGRNQD